MRAGKSTPTQVASVRVCLEIILTSALERRVSLVLMLAANPRWNVPAAVLSVPNYRDEDKGINIFKHATYNHLMSA